MSNNQLTATDNSGVIEQVLVAGDLSKLTAQQRTEYYMRVCQSLGLNALTRPFDYITLNGKLTLYARKDATEQLRRLNSISIDKPDVRFEDEWIIVTVAAHDNAGRTDSDIGVVSRKDMRGDFGNALMKAVTKAKRRVTLSICGLGMLDETEVETIPDAKLEAAVIPALEHKPAPATPAETQPAPAGVTKTTVGAPSLEEAMADWRSTWGQASKLGVQRRELQATTAENVNAIVDKTNALKDAIKAKGGSSAGK